jgi:hypothetical protein
MLLEARSHYSPKSKNPVFEAPGRKSASSGKSGPWVQKQRARRFDAEPLLRIEVDLVYAKRLTDSANLIIGASIRPSDLLPIVGSRNIWFIPSA